MFPFNLGQGELLPPFGELPCLSMILTATRTMIN